MGALDVTYPILSEHYCYAQSLDHGFQNHPEQHSTQGHTFVQSQISRTSSRALATEAASLSLSAILMGLKGLIISPAQTLNQIQVDAWQLEYELTPAQDTSG